LIILEECDIKVGGAVKAPSHPSAAANDTNKKLPESRDREVFILTTTSGIGDRPMEKRVRRRGDESRRLSSAYTRDRFSETKSWH
jgi:hypothetical protein